MFIVSSAAAQVPTEPGGGSKFVYDGLSYRTLDSETCEVVGFEEYTGEDGITGVKYQEEIVIPEVAMYGNTPLTVTAVGVGAFSGMNIIKTVTFGKKVQTIGERAFSGCFDLREIKDWGESLETIGKEAFKGCFLERAFSDVEISYADLAFPPTLKTICDNAFEGCSNINVKDWGESLESIGEEAFYNCDDLTKACFPATLKTIGKKAFSGCSSMTYYVLPPSMISLGEEAFYGTNTTKVVMPSSVAKPNSVWDGTSTVVFHGFDIFDCMVQTMIVYPADDAIMEDGCIYSKDKKILYYVPVETAGEFTVPSGVEEIGIGAFTFCDYWSRINAPGISKINVPSMVTTIGDYAFLKLPDTEISFDGASLKEIGSYAFAGDNLTSLHLTGNVNIGDNAFYRCGSLKSVELGETLSIGKYAFRGSDIAEISITSSVTEIPDCPRLWSTTATGR